MIKGLEGCPPGIRFFSCLGLVTLLISACCPTGPFEDNFGRLYALVTIPTDDSLQTFETSGTLDTGDWGCGLWSIRPPGELEPPVAPGDIAFVAVNPSPNPADQCCYAFRFDGRLAGSGCTVILGEYQDVGGTCEQRGQMFLQSAQ
jgi:hypothetical protein